MYKKLFLYENNRKTTIIFKIWRRKWFLFKILHIIRENLHIIYSNYIFWLYYLKQDRLRNNREQKQKRIGDFADCLVRKFMRIRLIFFLKLENCFSLPCISYRLNFEISIHNGIWFTWLCPCSIWFHLHLSTCKQWTIVDFLWLRMIKSW